MDVPTKEEMLNRISTHLSRRRDSGGRPYSGRAIHGADGPADVKAQSSSANAGMSGGTTKTTRELA